MGFSDKYDRTQMAMAEMLRDQAAAVPSVLVDHPAPAPRYTGETVSKSLSRGLQDADTMEKWLRELMAGTAIVTFKSRKDAPQVMVRALPTIKDGAGNNTYRQAIVKRLGRPAEPTDIVETILDAVDELEGAWAEYEMVRDPDELGVTVGDLRRRLAELEAPGVSVAQLKSEPAVISAARRKELECISMFNACGVVLQNWSRDLALALGEGVADYAKKAARFKQDHHGGIGLFKDVRAALLAAHKANKRSCLGREKRRSEIRNNTLPMRRARRMFHRLAVTSGDVLGWD